MVGPAVVLAAGGKGLLVVAVATDTGTYRRRVVTFVTPVRRRDRNDATGGIAVSRVQVEDADAWSRGWLVFRNEPLSAVVAEVNRYATTPIALADPALGNLRLSGNFRVGDSASMASAMAALLPLRVTTQGEGLALAEK